nr:hypothetical protein [Acidobacteriota bacterium]
ILLEGLHPETKWTLAGRERTGVSARALIGEVERFSASEMPNSLPVPIKTVSNWQRGLLTISNNSLTVHEAGGAHGELLVYFDYPSGTTLRVLVEGKRIFSGAPRSILLANGNLLEYKVNGPQSALLFLNVGDISHPGSAAINK